MNRRERRWKIQRRRRPAYRARRALRRWIRASRIAGETTPPDPGVVARMARIEARRDWPWCQLPKSTAGNPTP